MWRLLRVLAVFLALAAVGASGAGRAVGQTTTSSPPPTTAPPPTTEAPPPPTAPPSTEAPPAGPPDTAGLVQPPAGRPSTTAPATTTTTRPRASIGAGAAAAYVDNLVRTGANSTRALLDALRAVEGLGLSREEVVRVGFGSFPVGGLASFTDDWHAPRFTPTFHVHQGTDIFAAFDTPVRAPADGVLRFAEEAVGGKSAYVTAADGTFYYMTHLKAFAPGMTSGRRVTRGTVVGLVGDSGNAKGGPPHVHFEIHPQGGSAVNPKPVLDRWLAEALAAVPGLLSGYVQDQPAVLLATGLTRRFDVGELDQRAGPPMETLLWASSMSPAGSALRLAEVQVGRVADAIDWDERAARQEFELARWQAAEDAVRTMLWRLTPPGVTAAVGGPSS
jgi:murein DD-endopeptidase MepM/ murein hydrolase activator NlpD